MQRPPLVDIGRPVWRCLLVAAALLVAVQSFSAGLLAARGPLHAHRPDRVADALTLADFRRVLAPAAEAGPSHGHADVDAHGHARADADADADAHTRAHGHAHAVRARHHHAGGDVTVLALDDEAARAASALAADEAGVAQPAFLPLPSSAPLLPDPEAAAVAGGRGTDRWQSHFTAPPERPPRVA